MADILPNSRGAIVHYGALPAFCSRLLTIEYIDLAGGYFVPRSSTSINPRVTTNRNQVRALSVCKFEHSHSRH